MEGCLSEVLGVHFETHNDHQRYLRSPMNDSACMLLGHSLHLASSLCLPVRASYSQVVHFEPL